MEGVITVQDSRQTLTNMQNWRKEAVKTVQQQKTQDGVKNVLNTVLDVAKIATMAVGSVATIVAALSPAPVLSPVIAKSSTALTAAIDGGKALLNGAPTQEGVEKITAAMSDLKGSVKDVSIRDKNIVKPNEPVPIQPITASTYTQQGVAMAQNGIPVSRART